MTANEASITRNASIGIVGAGVGGLVTALQLHANGFRNIQLFEAASKVTSLGVGINVQPHAVLILRDLGLLDALKSTGVETQELNYYDQYGNPIISEPRGHFAGYKVPQFSIHRGHLQMLLLEAVKERLGSESVLLNHSLDSYEQVTKDDEEKVKLRFVQKRTQEPATASEFEADLVVAADGINSTVRRILYPEEGPAHFSGRLLWRGCLEREPYLTGASMIWSGHANQKFIAYPIVPVSSEANKQKTLINWIAELRVRDENDPDTTPPEKPDWTISIPKEKFAYAFDKWTFGFLNVPELIEKTEKVYEFPMCDRNPVERWSFGNLTLLGDAAHPMYPIGSNGASQAILDSASLTKYLLKCMKLSDIPEALQEYQNERLPATSRIVNANRGNGPDHVMQIAHERAPNGFKHINDIIPQEELESIGSVYKNIAGFEVEKVNAMAEQSEGTADRLGLRSPRAWTAKNVDEVVPNGVQATGPTEAKPVNTAIGINGLAGGRSNVVLHDLTTGQERRVGGEAYEHIVAITLTEKVLGFVTLGSSLYVADLQSPEEPAVRTALPSSQVRAFKSDGNTIALSFYPDKLAVYNHINKRLELYHHARHNITEPGIKEKPFTSADILVSEAQGTIDVFGHTSTFEDSWLEETNSSARSSFRNWIGHARYVLESRSRETGPLTPVTSSFIGIEPYARPGHYGFSGEARATGTDKLYRIRLDVESDDADLEYTDGSPHSSVIFDAKTLKLYVERHQLTGLEHGRLSGAVTGHIVRWRDAVYCIHYFQDWRLTVFTVRLPDIDAAGDAEGLAQNRNTLGRRVDALGHNKYEHPKAAFVNDSCIVTLGYYAWDSERTEGQSGRISVFWFDEASTLAGGHDTGLWMGREETRFPWTLDLERQYVIPKARGGDGVAAV
ncbi:hypothetical protein LTR56_004900 [Elasticomyces elasticus]|nr:hypothetical protein LTR56_004900 [Elasticomyces elasticus]KAK4913737.1 hypothetical protein LTR49_017994 [Elasticomyces elasticus]